MINYFGKFIDRLSHVNYIVIKVHGSNGHPRCAATTTAKLIPCMYQYLTWTDDVDSYFVFCCANTSIFYKDAAFQTNTDII